MTIIIDLWDVDRHHVFTSNDAIILQPLRLYINKVMWLTKEAWLAAHSVQVSVRPAVAWNASACSERHEMVTVVAWSHRSIVIVITYDLFWSHSDCHVFFHEWIVPLMLEQRGLHYVTSLLSSWEPNSTSCEGMTHWPCKIWMLYRGHSMLLSNRFLKDRPLFRWPRKWRHFWLSELPDYQGLGTPTQERPHRYC